MTSNDPKLPDKPRNGTPEPGEPTEPLVEAEALRSQLQQALARTSRLIATLKQQQRQQRAVEAAMASLRRLQLGP